MFGPSSRLSYSQGCSRKSWATLTHEDYGSRLPGVAGSHLRCILPGASHTQCLQSRGELPPTSACLLLAFPVGFVRLPGFQLQWFCNQVICFSAPVGDGCGFEAVLQEFSNTEWDPDGMAQVSEGMSSLHSSI